MYFVIPRASAKRIAQRNTVKIIMDKLRQNMEKIQYSKKKENSGLKKGEGKKSQF